MSKWWLTRMEDKGFCLCDLYWLLGVCFDGRVV